jgi:hypothetical protein
MGGFNFHYGWIEKAGVGHSFYLRRASHLSALELPDRLRLPRWPFGVDRRGPATRTIFLVI